ncbi:uncharacterized protein LOC115927400 [Strongylocentrotus purpuratus]|uniref:Uncharacterized protein n=1 Tax=Strongylocentrotus purpuratus TaxID=7668 RepID=A0A7M7T2I7_STRPU|nr:uncharacterized protein LOC115927400 [Strongylocentrotus purpuratus]
MGQLHIIGIRQCIRHDWCTQGNWGMPQKVSAKLGCPNQLIDLAAKAVSSALPYSIDSLLIDVFYYLEASVNRKLNLIKFQMLIGNEASAGNSETCLYEMAELGPMLAKIYLAMASSSPFFKGEVSAQQKKPTQKTKQKMPTQQTKQKKLTQQTKATKNCVQTALVPKKPTPAVKNKPAQGSQLQEKPPHQTKMTPQLHEAFRIPKKVSADPPHVSKPAQSQTQVQLQAPQPQHSRPSSSCTTRGKTTSEGHFGYT